MTQQMYRQNVCERFRVEVAGSIARQRLTGQDAGDIRNSGVVASLAHRQAITLRREPEDLVRDPIEHRRVEQQNRIADTRRPVPPHRCLCRNDHHASWCELMPDTLARGFTDHVTARQTDEDQMMPAAFREVTRAAAALSVFELEPRPAQTATRHR